MKTFTKMALVAALLLTGCKSEVDKLVDKACGTDLGEWENRDVCEEAVEENCGDAYREAKSIQIDISALKRREILGRMFNEGLLTPEAKAELKEEEKELEEKWDNLAMSSTCKDAIEDLYDAERKKMNEKIVEFGKKAVTKGADGFFSSIVDKVKGFFAFSSRKSSVEAPSPEKGEPERRKASHKMKKQSVFIKENKLRDDRDGKIYRTMNFNGKMWMAENLNFALKGSSCYENQSENCEKYGRLYTWNGAMSACLNGWRLPNNEDFEQIKILLEQEFGKGRAGEGLKSLGFVPVFAGDGFGEKYQLVDESNYLWSADDEGNRAYDWVITTNSNDFFMGNIKYSLKANKMSVRCIQD